MLQSRIDLNGCAPGQGHCPQPAWLEAQKQLQVRWLLSILQQNAFTFLFFTEQCDDVTKLSYEEVSERDAAQKCRIEENLGSMTGCRYKYHVIFS